MQLDIRHLRTLQALAQEGSLSAAAARLHLTQSALSHQLKALEEQLGAPLYLRKSRPLRFTRQGERLLELAEEVLPRIDAARRDLQRMGTGARGRLFIAIECHSCFAWLMPTMDRYRHLWPEVEMDLTTSFAFDPLPALRSGELDLVVTSDPRPGQGIHYEPLFEHEALLALAADHPLTARRWIRPEDLRDETIITYPVARDRLDVFSRFLDPAGIEPRAVRQTELTVMMVQLVASRRGVAALPDWALAEHLAAGQVVARPLGRHGLHGMLHAAIRESECDMPWMTDFIRTAREVAGQRAGSEQPAGR
ncbi:MAG: LysR family transcriptional regulator [Gammaproteobacteria bacterium]|nr:MAG: LysR family transcriptional regulator [Gammaproteobacteria bacterium]